MSWLKRERSTTPVASVFEAVDDSYDVFMAAYDPSDATAPHARRLLGRALTNGDPAARIAIATQLLDDGADPAERSDDGTTTLHALLGHGTHDFAAEVPLLRRLLEGGADVNAVIVKFGTPLETLAEQFKFSDHQLAPFYDVLLGWPDLDPLQVSLNGRTVLATIRKWAQLRADLVSRLETLLRERGIPVPEAE